MLKKFTILFLLTASCIIYLPANAAAYAPGEKTGSVAGLATDAIVLSQKRGRGRGNGGWDDRWRRRRSGSWYGYKNYGQYRRTQVGNRRYRLVRRSYWRDGIRLTRYVRIYY